MIAMDTYVFLSPIMNMARPVGYPVGEQHKYLEVEQCRNNWDKSDLIYFDLDIAMTDVIPKILELI